MRSSGLIIFSCAGLLVSGGIILGGTVAWSLLRMSYYFWLSDLGVELASSIAILAGSILCLPICWLATLVPYYPKSTSMSATLVGITSVAILLMSVGLSSMTALSRAVREPTALNRSMQHAMSVDVFDTAVRNSLASMQLELKCCGVESYADWYQHRRILPPSCCGHLFNGKPGDMCAVPFFTMGCLRPAIAELKYFANTITTLTGCLVIVMAVMLFASSYMLVIHEVERGKLSSFKQLTPLRIGIACLSNSPPSSAPRATFVDPSATDIPIANII